jgi:hypothetical protein
MILINEITNQAKQTFVFTLTDGSNVAFSMTYVDNQQGWFYSVSHASTGFAVSNRRMVMSPNMLRAFREIIPFGFMVATTDGEEPIFQNDFVNGRASFYLLNAADLPIAEQVISA